MLKKTFKKKMDNIRKGAINATATVIAAPKIIKSKLEQRQSTKDYNTLKLARGYDNAPDRNNDGSFSDAYKARFMADEVRSRLTKKKNK